MNKIQRSTVLSLTFALFISLGVLGLAFAPSTAYAAKAADTVGVVDYEFLIDQHPDMEQANQAYRTESEQATKEYESKQASLNDEEKQKLKVELAQRIEQKRQQLLGAILEKVDTAIQQVAKDKGLNVIVHKNAVVFGGLDINKDVVAKFK